MLLPSGMGDFWYTPIQGIKKASRLEGRLSISVVKMDYPRYAFNAPL